MKRKRKTEKPAWQTHPMRDIVTLIEGWEVLKFQRSLISDRPEEMAALQRWRDGLPLSHQVYVSWLDSIVPAARAEIALWLDPETEGAVAVAAEAVVPTASRLSGTVFLVIVRLWERFLAAGELGGSEARTRWFAEQDRETRRLLTRLTNRIPVKLS